MKVSCVVLTRNAGSHAKEMTRALSRQSLQPIEVLAFDSASTDGSLDEFAKFGADIHRVDPQEFDHARVRNIAASMARGDVLVFLTQDAIPATEKTLQRLVSPVGRGEVVAAFGRHLPRAGATPLERFARERNYAPVSRLISSEDIERTGIRAFFFSNACSAIHREDLLELGGFPDGTVMNEDMLFAAVALRNGRRLAYVAEATVWHSHRYSPRDTFKRYFDVGTVFTDRSDMLSGTRTEREGAGYVVSLIRQLIRERQAHWIPSAFLESVLKAAGFWIGKHYRFVPSAFRPRLSLHPEYWSTRKTEAGD